MKARLEFVIEREVNKNYDKMLFSNIIRKGTLIKYNKKIQVDYWILERHASNIVIE